MKKPIILITTSNANDPQFAGVIGDTDIIYSDRAAVKAVVEAGGLPMYMPALPLIKEADIRQYLEKADGVLITGADTHTNPEYYGEKVTHLKGRIDDERDQVDILLIKLAYKLKLPILGICKGMQVINVALGGTLYQHLGEQLLPGEVDHLKKHHRTVVTHHAVLAEGSMLRGIFGSDSMGVNGSHQQAVKVLADKLRPVAVADDGIVEAYEGADYPFLIGTQFHAELMLDEPSFGGIFKSFIEAASGK